MSRYDGTGVRLPTIVGVRELWAESAKINTQVFVDAPRHSFVCGSHFTHDQLIFNDGKISGVIKNSLPRPHVSEKPGPTGHLSNKLLIRTPYSRPVATSSSPLLRSLLTTPSSSATASHLDSLDNGMDFDECNNNVSNDKNRNGAYEKQSEASVNQLDDADNNIADRCNSASGTKKVPEDDTHFVDRHFVIK